MKEPIPAAAVVGFPVKHSLSPLIHGLWLQAAGIDGFYVTCDPPPDAFCEAVARLRAEGFAGINVTVPYKEAALTLADEVHDSARLAGAANLLVFREGKILAHNTDGIGMIEALLKQNPHWSVRDGPVVIIGAGGAARGAAAAMYRPEKADIRIVNRTLCRAEALAERFEGRAYDFNGMGAALKGAQVVINATTRGLNDVDPLILPWPHAPPGAVALDMVYRPLRTSFLTGAAALGWATADGLAMLIGQARPSFEAFFGQAPPAGVDVRAACLEAMGA